MGERLIQDNVILGEIMEILRCVHCGLEGDGVHANPHKSTCTTTGKDDTYVRVGKATTPKPTVEATPEAKPEKSSTKPKKSKGRK